jgi:hypothetical protein
LFTGVLGTDQVRSPDVAIGFGCPTNLDNTGLLKFTNNGTDTINVFYDVGETNPGYRSLGPDGEYFDLPTHPDGEFVSYQVQGVGVATCGVVEPAVDRRQVGVLQPPKPDPCRLQHRFHPNFCGTARCRKRLTIRQEKS